MPFCKQMDFLLVDVNDIGPLQCCFDILSASFCGSYSTTCQVGLTDGTCIPICYLSFENFENFDICDDKEAFLLHCL